MNNKELEKLKASFDKLSIDEQIAAKVQFAINHPDRWKFPPGQKPIDRIVPREWDAYNRATGSSTDPRAILIVAGAALVVGTFLWIKDALTGNED